MKRNGFALTYLLMVILQILICNYLRLPFNLVLSVLPVIVLFIPINHGTIFSLFLAFFTGLVVDFLAEGVIGINALALVPVAFCRKAIITMVFGSEIFARRENLSVKKHGIGKVTLAIIIAQSIFLLIYIWADGSAARPGWYNTLEFSLSLIAGLLLSLLISGYLTQEDRSA